MTASAGDEQPTDRWLLAVEAQRTCATRPGTGSNPHRRPVPVSSTGIRPDLRLFEVDMYAFTEHDPTGADGLPLRWPVGELGTVDLDMPVEKVR
ncbi:MAG: hypothetical protein ACRDT2_02615 [Natronosporangium sp.]